MAGGTPLTDEDRWPWLDRLGEVIEEAVSDKGRVVLVDFGLAFDPELSGLTTTGGMIGTWSTTTMSKPRTTLHGSRNAPEERHPLRLREHDSDLDGRASTMIELPITAGPLWRRVIEEPRRLDENRAMVMAILELPLVGARGWPFMYERV